ncbi:hypothetical protein NE237_018703 [Protea cynaroides]|uniref:Serpin domain-containing protein n=1 Tax=Protea cynaroides TaxID=273540 RepID=A0A9Q0QPE9_9MAGN|nr:hypothetical protein NE237_018703 [Protea cynaroides]
MVDSTLGQMLCVSSIFHKSYIEVNEEGTEAVASASVKFKEKGANFQLMLLKINQAYRVFVFFLKLSVVILKSHKNTTKKTGLSLLQYYVTLTALFRSSRKTNWIFMPLASILINYISVPTYILSL